MRPARPTGKFQTFSIEEIPTDQAKISGRPGPGSRGARKTREPFGSDWTAWTATLSGPAYATPPTEINKKWDENNGGPSLTDNGNTPTTVQFDK